MSDSWYIEFLATVRLKTLYETLHICRVNEFSLSLYFQHKYSLYGQFRGQKVMISILYLNAKLNPLLIDENYFLNWLNRLNFSKYMLFCPFSRWPLRAIGYDLKIYPKTFLNFWAHRLLTFEISAYSHENAQFDDILN